MIKSYAGIGSRSTPIEIMRRMQEKASSLENLGFVLRSGAAQGADTAFESGTEIAEIYLPWKGFNGSRSNFVEPSEEAIQLAATIHPAWQWLRRPARLLHARNCHQVLGRYLDNPVSFVLCWTPDGAETESQYSIKTTGGTGTAIVLASRRGIPVINMKNLDWEQKLDDVLGEL